MITKGQVNRLKTLAAAEALLAQWRAEDQADHLRVDAIEAEIKALRTELNQLRRGVNAGVTEDDILLKMGMLHDESTAGGGGPPSGGPPSGGPSGGGA